MYKLCISKKNAWARVSANLVHRIWYSQKEHRPPGVQPPHRAGVPASVPFRAKYKVWFFVDFKAWNKKNKETTCLGDQSNTIQVVCFVIERTRSVGELAGPIARNTCQRLKATGRTRELSISLVSFQTIIDMEEKRCLIERSMITINMHKNLGT